MKFFITWLVFALVIFVTSKANAQSVSATSGTVAVATVTGISVNTTTRVVTVSVSSVFSNSAFGRWGVTWIGTNPANNIGTQNLRSSNGNNGSYTNDRTFTYPLGSTVTVYMGAYIYQASGDNEKYNANQISFVLGADGSINPTPTLSPSGGAGSILTGQTFNGTASGRLGTGAYNISIVSGAGSASINATTGAFTVTAGSTGGVVNYKVWISSGGGYGRSPDASANITVGLSKKVRVTIPANNGQFPIVYKLYQGGVEIGSTTQLAGASAIITTIDVGDDDSPVTMKSFTSGIMTDGVVIVEDVAGVIELDIPTVITPTADPSTPPVTITPPVTSSTLAQTAQDSQPALVWSSTGGTSGDALTNGVFREGVGKVVNAMTGGDMEPIPDQTPQIEALEADANTKLDTMFGGLESVGDATGDVQADLESRKPTLVGVEGSQWVYTLPMPMLTENIVIDLTWAETPINLMRTVIKVAFLLFMWFLYGRTLRSASV